MEITLEKIELVKDRTGVSYKEAKEALEAADGSVVDAIVAIEEALDVKGHGKINEQGAQLIEKIKAAIKKGNVAKIIVKRDDEILLNLPVNIGIIGTVLAPWAAVAGIVAVFGTKCQIELVKDNGEIIEITEIAVDTFEDVMEKGSAFADEVKNKSTDVFGNVKSKATEVMSKVKKEEDGYVDGDLDDDDDDCECVCGSDQDCDEKCHCGCDGEVPPVKIIE